MTTTTLPGLIAGTWKIDPTHSEIGFTVRHMMVSKVRGRFREFDATLVVAEDPTQSTAEATIEASSLDTGNQQRDDHIRSADFFDAENHPRFSFRSTAVRPDGDDYVLVGELTLHGVTRTVELELEYNGGRKDPYGNDRVGFSLEGEINRRDFGITIEMPMDGGGVVVGDKVKLEIDAEFTRQGD
ncbi:YceI family protein [Allonocardiopsis opalescens]|uniref:Polyisoprenoid-binding protein YceI n=1 Tax=Allonocardiopsis opalescens TaxID=1144618 RepID=A0A2T0Q3T7_9ACTN|nr:YceI family protein [Allonocardiopsis opalescens]PRX98457.1 polyisoprenoid-binding protein YceI [Allonocardiopsis opalescens]